MSRYTMISSDCHAAPPLAEYRPYVDPACREDFDRWLRASEERAAAARRERIGGALFDEEYVERAMETKPVATGGLNGAWDDGLRQRELEADGVAGEVIFSNGAPFTVAPGPREGAVPPALQLEGARAYNRWLAELCALAPGRRAGVISITLHDIDASVAEIRRAREDGLMGGVMMPSAGHDNTPFEFYNHPRYEPLWQVCDELGLPLQCHGGGGNPSYGEFPGSLGVYLTEVTFYSHRPFWFLLWAGVFERYPNLQFVLTEQTVDWVPDTLEFMDYLYAGPLFKQLRSELSLKPSEYFARQCWLGASFMTRMECERRHDMGVDRIMFGTDYPHVEGTWPNTASRLRHTFEGVAEDEVSAMLGGNALRCFDFDAEAIAKVAERVGPEVNVLAGGPTPEDLARNGTAYLLR